MLTLSLLELDLALVSLTFPADAFRLFGSFVSIKLLLLLDEIIDEFDLVTLFLCKYSGGE